ncbi:MAG: hypothetical protein LBK67_02265 [Coriobacteriales bacterium]|jgi:hypothetical protein|nr:hypothetical protein [Coriobacteriales bacterium]
MTDVTEIVLIMRANTKGVRFVDLKKVCDSHFGEPRIKGSHHFYAVPWKGEPLVNIQNDKGEAKSYQVKQVLKAIDLLTSSEKGGENA